MFIDFRESNSLLENVNMEEQKSGQESGKQGKSLIREESVIPGRIRKVRRKYKELNPENMEIRLKRS